MDHDLDGGIEEVVRIIDLLELHAWRQLSRHILQFLINGVDDLRGVAASCLLQHGSGYGLAVKLCSEVVGIGT